MNPYEIFQILIPILALIVGFSVLFTFIYEGLRITEINSFNPIRKQYPKRNKIIDKIYLWLMKRRLLEYESH